LITLAKYKKLTPLQQGFVQYMQGAWPTSELKNEKNPYPKGSKKYKEWNDGQTAGVLAAQDADD
jgi:hypothetical protein